MAEILAPDVANFLAKEHQIVSAGSPIPEKLPLPLREQMPQELLSVTETLKRISGTWNPVEIYTANADSINVERQKVFEAFDRGEEYNPNLTYSYANNLEISEARGLIGGLLHAVRKFTPEDRISRLFRTALYFKLKDDIATCDLVDGIKTKNENKIATALRTKYPGLDENLYQLAQDGYQKLTIEGDPDDQEEILGNGLLTPDQYRWLRNKVINPEEQEQAFRWALEQYGLLKKSPSDFGYEVISTKDVTGIDVRDKSVNGPTIFLPTDRPKPMTADKLLVLMAHEIEGHALHRANGEKLTILGGGSLKIDEETQYEGLGLHRETAFRKKMYGQDEAAPRPYYVFAAKMAEEGASFYQIFSDQMKRKTHVRLRIPEGQPLPDFGSIDQKIQAEIKRASWLVTYRVMRGHVDMANPGSFAMNKDLGYLRGFQVAKQMEENGRGHVNESAVVASGGLQLLAELDITEDKLPYRFKNVATKYCMEVMLPQMETSA